MTLKSRRVSLVGRAAIEDARLDVYLDGVDGGEHQQWRSVSVEGSKAVILEFLGSPAALTLMRISTSGDESGCIVGGYPTFVNRALPSGLRAYGHLVETAPHV